MLPIFLWGGGILCDRLLFETTSFVYVEYICHVEYVDMY